jgi:hypothetical protein
MATHFGSVATDYVEAIADEALATRTDQWIVPGIDGIGVQTLGSNVSRFRFHLQHYDTAANIDTWIAAMRALQGTVVTAEDDWGASHSNLYVESMNFEAKEARLVPGSGTVTAYGAMVASGFFTA